MIETWYDIACNCCNKHLSSDYGTGMSLIKAEVIKWAKAHGWEIKSNTETYCSTCKTKRR